MPDGASCDMPIVPNGCFYPVNVQGISHTSAFVSEGEAVVATAVDSVVDSAVETAVEVMEPPPPDITQLCRDTFHKTADYLTGELEGKLLLVLVVSTRALCRIKKLHKFWWTHEC